MTGKGGADAGGAQPAAIAADPELGRAAAAHACTMVVRNSFSHMLGGSPRARMRRAGCNARLTGENIAMGFARGAQVFREWRESAAHRRIMSMQGAAVTGIGVIAPQPGQGGGPRWVLNVATPCR